MCVWFSWLVASSEQRTLCAAPAVHLTIIRAGFVAINVSWRFSCIHVLPLLLFVLSGVAAVLCVLCFPCGVHAAHGVHSMCALHAVAACCAFRVWRDPNYRESKSACRAPRPRCAHFLGPIFWWGAATRGALSVRGLLRGPGVWRERN